MKPAWQIKHEQDHNDFVEAVNKEMVEIRQVCFDESVTKSDSKVETDRKKKKFDEIFGEATQNKMAVKYSEDFMTAFFTKDKDEMYSIFNYMVSFDESERAEKILEQKKEDFEENAASDIAEEKADAWRSQHGD